MIFWTKSQRSTFIKTALTNFHWVPCAFIVLMVEETGECPYKISKLSWTKFDLDKGVVKIGRHNYPLSEPLLGLLREQKSRLHFQTKAFPVFQPKSMQWHTIPRHRLLPEFQKVKRQTDLPAYLGPDNLRVSVFRDRVNDGQLPTDVAKDMHLTLKQFEEFWRGTQNVSAYRTR
jgi:hypothetical protein